MKMNKKTLIMLIALIGSALLIVSMVLPYASATKEQAEWLKSVPDKIDLTLKLSYRQVINISMFEYAAAYSRMGSRYAVYTVLVAAICVFSLAVLLFSIFKKPIAIIVFDVLAVIVLSIQTWDYKDRGVIPSSSYNWGIAVYLFYIAAAIVLAAAVVMLIMKLKIKKRAKAFINSNSFTDDLNEIEPAAGNAESVYSPDNSLLQDETCDESDVSPSAREQNPSDSDYKVKNEAPKPPCCPNCGTVLREGLVFCPGCGKKIEKPVRQEAEAPKPPCCPNCGTVLREGLVFCPGCGKKIEKPVRQEVEAPKPPCCPNCGTVLREGLLFCPGCGRKLK